MRKPRVMSHNSDNLKLLSHPPNINTNNHTIPKLTPNTQYTSNKMLGFLSMGTSYTQRYFPSGQSTGCVDLMSLYFWLFIFFCLAIVIVNSFAKIYKKNHNSQLTIHNSQLKKIEDWKMKSNLLLLTFLHLTFLLLTFSLSNLQKHYLTTIINIQNRALLFTFYNFVPK